jgi:hypothetical protein
MNHKATDFKARREQQPRVETQVIVICNYFKEAGHQKYDCFKLLRKNQTLGNSNQRNGIESATTDIVLSDINSHEPFKIIWIGDSGVSYHYYNSDEGLFYQTKISEIIAVGNRSTIKAEKFGKLRSCVIQCYGRNFEIKFENVKFAPDLWINLFSINKALMNVFMIGNEGLLIKMTKGETSVVFDQRLNIKGVFVSAIKMVPYLF